MTPEQPSEGSVHAAGTGSSPSPDNPDTTSSAVTCGVIGVGIALIETSLIPGMLIGAALALAPKYAPNLGDVFRPLFKVAVRGVYKVAQKTREIVAEAGEQVQDLMAEARFEEAEAAKAAASKPNAQTM